MDKMYSYTEEEILELNIECKSLELVNFLDLVLNPTEFVGGGNTKPKPSPPYITINRIWRNETKRNRRVGCDCLDREEIEQPFCIDFLRRRTAMNNKDDTNTENDNATERLASDIFSGRIDLDRASFFGERAENNNVLRIFKQLRSLYNYLSDNYPSLQVNYVPSSYVYELPQKINIPRTMNIQYHVQFANGKLSRFISKMKRLLESNKHFDYSKYTECFASIRLLEIMTEELSRMRNTEMRHTDFVFISNAAHKMAEHLETLLTSINSQVRECHLFVTVFNWEMDQEHRQSRRMIMERQKTLDYALQLVFEDKYGEILEIAKRKLASINLPERYDLADVVAAASYFSEMLDQMIATPELFASSYMINLHLRQQAQANIDLNLPTDGTAGTASDSNEWYDVADLLLQDLLFAHFEQPKGTGRSRKPFGYIG